MLIVARAVIIFASLLVKISISREAKGVWRAAAGTSLLVSMRIASC